MNNSQYLSKEIFNRKVLVIVFDPLIKNPPISSNSISSKYIPDDGVEVRLSDYLKEKGKTWKDEYTSTQELINTFLNASNGRLNYKVVKTIIADSFPLKENGVNLNTPGIPEYKRCIDENDDMTSKCFQKICQVGIDYEALLKNYPICEMANRNEIDEVWMWGYSWMGFNESRLVGRNSYWMNGEEIPSANCDRPIPIMGLSLQRELGNAIESFGHRMEIVMGKVYGNMDVRNILTRWDKFIHLNLPISGYQAWSGPVHLPPNARYEYDYANSGKGITNIDDFKDYILFNSQKLLEESQNKRQMDCNEWGCNKDDWEFSHTKYLQWWFGNLPQFNGSGWFDNVPNDWFAYFATPELAVTHPANLSYLNDAKKSCESQPGKKYFSSCNLCDFAIKKTAEVCSNFCLSIGSDKEKCIQNEKSGNGCSWFKDCSKCGNTGANFQQVCPCYCDQLDVQQCISENAKINGCVIKNGSCQKQTNEYYPDLSCAPRFTDECSSNKNVDTCESQIITPNTGCIWFGGGGKTQCYRSGTMMEDITITDECSIYTSLDTCDAHNESCAWYVLPTKQKLCLNRGTIIPYVPKGNLGTDDCNNFDTPNLCNGVAEPALKKCTWYTCSNKCFKTGTEAESACSFPITTTPAPQWTDCP